MIIHERKYIKPSKIARVLSLLDALAVDSALPQHELGERSFLSGAMVNQYLREMQQQGLISFVPANGKSFRYELTELGEARCRGMFAEYCSELVRLYSSLKDGILERFADLDASGKRRIVLFGASETCEVVISALRESSFQVMAVVDNDPEKHGKRFHGQVIQPPDVIETLSCQAIVITSYGRQDEICRQILPLATRNGMEIVRL